MMMNKNKSCALVNGIREPADKAGLVQKIADTLQQADDPELTWAALRLRRYLLSKGTSIDACLGLKPRQGGQHETLYALSMSTRRDGLINDLVRLLPGAITAKAETLSGWLEAGGPPPSVNGDVVEKYRNLLRAFPDTPRSARQLTRILKGQTVAAQVVTDKPDLTSVWRS